MNKFFGILILLLFTWSLVLAQTNPNHVWVNGYYRSNGTYVEGYYRTAPNHTNVDNFSTRGNINPYTGETGWVSPDNYSNPWKIDKKKEVLYEVRPYVTSSTYSNYNNLKSEKSKHINEKTSSTSYLNFDWYSKGNQVNVRFNGNSSSKIAFRINRGDKIDVIDRSKNKDYISGYGEDYWYKIRYQNVTGWVFGKLIGKKEYSSTYPTDWDGEYIIITADNVNVRSEPSTEIGKIKFRLNSNAEVEVIAKTNDKYFVDGYGNDYWYYIKENNRQGWVFGKLTSF